MPSMGDSGRAMGSEEEPKLVRCPGSHQAHLSRLPSLIPQMLLYHLNGKWVRSWQGRGHLSRRQGDAGRLPGVQGSDSRLCSLSPEGPGPLHAISSPEQAGGQAWGQSGPSSGLVLQARSRCVTSACLCNSPSSTLWSLSQGSGPPATVEQ